jgi:deazaflavin-dependent oxidoreductase (nitroreductase family)
VTPHRLLLDVEWAIHRGFHRLTGGRFSTQAPTAGKVGTLFLVSTGRRSGKQRRNGLFYIVDGENLVVVASNAGENVDPQWWKNLQATPDAVVEIGRGQQPVRARQATPDEADRLWPELERGYPEFAVYRAQLARKIPVVILEPR